MPSPQTELLPNLQRLVWGKWGRLGMIAIALTSLALDSIYPLEQLNALGTRYASFGGIVVKQMVQVATSPSALFAVVLALRMRIPLGAATVRERFGTIPGVIPTLTSSLRQLLAREVLYYLGTRLLFNLVEGASQGLRGFELFAWFLYLPPTQPHRDWLDMVCLSLQVGCTWAGTWAKGYMAACMACAILLWLQSPMTKLLAYPTLIILLEVLVYPVAYVLIPNSYFWRTLHETIGVFFPMVFLTLALFADLLAFSSLGLLLNPDLSWRQLARR